MHILVLILTALGGAAFWWYRLKSIRDAGSEMVDVFGRARGKVRRNKLRRHAEKSPVTAIDNPIIAAATLLISLVNSSPMPPVQENLVRDQLGTIADGETLEEAIVYGRWVQTQALDSRATTILLCEKLTQWLSLDERRELLKMIAALDKNKQIMLAKMTTELAIRKLSA